MRMNRSLKLALLVALAFGGGPAMALELGQIQVKSALGQPLVAEIPLRDVTPQELRGLNAQLAPPEAFARAGVSAGVPSVPLNFSVVDGPQGKVIRITSEQPVNDPYLDLLVQVDAAGNRTVHEYTLLLDPPGGAQPLPVPAQDTPRVAQTQPMAARPAEPSTARPSVPAGSAATGRPASGRYGPVTRGQTLSEIARATAPAGADISQMMLALKRANPEAFYRDNINALKAGAVLRVPDDAQVRATAVSAALAEVRRQNEAWRSDRAATAVAAGARSSPAAGDHGHADDALDRLALVPARQGGAGTGVHGTDRDELARNREALTALQQQDEELKSRLKDLEEINARNARLLALKDNEIAELQQKLAAIRQAVPPAAATSTPKTAAATPSATTTAPVAAPAANASVAQAARTPAPVPASAATAAAKSPASVAATQPSSGSAPAAKAAPSQAKPALRPAAPAAADEPWYMRPWAMGLAGVAVVALALAGLVARRRKPAAAPVAPRSLAEHFDDASADAEQDADQAALLDALSAHPDDVGLHLELVSLYYSRRDVERFEAAAEAMYAHVTDPEQPEWQDVLAMGRDLAPEHPLFAAPPARSAFSEVAMAERAADAASHAEVPPGETRSTTDTPAAGPVQDATLSPTPPVSESAPQRPLSEYHFDFHLTPTPVGTAARSEQRPAAEAAHGERDGAQDAKDRGWQAEEATDDYAELTGFSDDPVDTKLDLARAYLDMGDAEGARAMLEEVLEEGSQMQKDVARKLLADVH